MSDHQHNLRDISAVISSIRLLFFSVLSGRLADRWGRGPVILTGACRFCWLALPALRHDVFPLAVLFLLGLGWNFCFVGGSALLSDQLSPLERSRTQGTNDLLVGLASRDRQQGSGIVFCGIELHGHCHRGGRAGARSIFDDPALDKRRPSPVAAEIKLPGD